MDTLSLPYSRDEVHAERARRSLEAFIRYAWHAVEPETPYASNWHIGAMAYHLEAVTNGEIQNLLINVPPGFAKSLVCVVFWPAWEWGPRELPHLRYITASNGLSLAVRDTKRSRDLILSDWYQRHYGAVFELEDDQNQKTRYQNDHKGYRLAKSIGSGVGERGNRVIFDDPHELDDVFRPEALATAVHYNNVTLDSRLASREHDSRVVVQQRVAINDVAGDIMRKMNQGGKQYEVLCLPMEHDPSYQMAMHARNTLDWSDPRTESGELLDPERYSEASVEADKVTYADQAPAVLNQRPRQSTTAIFERHVWENGRNRYRLDDPKREIVARYMSFDLAMKDKETSAYNALVVLELVNPGYYLDVRYLWRDKLTFPRLMPLLGPMAENWNFDNKLRAFIIEDKAHGTTAVQTIEDGFDEWLKGILVAFEPGATAKGQRASKEQRWHQAAAWAEVNCLRLPEPDHTLDQVGDLYEFETELYNLPASEYKDWADAYSQGVLWAEHLIADGYRMRQRHKINPARAEVLEAIAGLAGGARGGPYSG